MSEKALSDRERKDREIAEENRKRQIRQGVLSPVVEEKKTLSPSQKKRESKKASAKKASAKKSSTK